ncbi:MAG: CAP domain-containing protein, partial [Acutalibacteraceae bacterium]|nr:CAP domain-containing protein [Acutalibacteraceae bacterium]
MKKLLSLAISLLLIIGMMSTVPSVLADSNLSEIAQEVIARTNLERQNKSLTLYKTNDNLNAAAQVRAKELAESFSHYRPNGDICFTVLNEYSIYFYSTAENIAQTPYGAEGAVSMWMASTQGHRENILSTEFTHIGVGVYEDYYVQLFVQTNSTAEDYLIDAYSESTTTTTTTVNNSLPGDVNVDGTISIADARMLLVAIATGDYSNIFEQGFINGDVNYDGTHSIADARKILVAIASGDFDSLKIQSHKNQKSDAFASLFFCYNYGGTNFGGVTDAHRKMRKPEVFCDTLCAPRQFQV